MSVVDVSYGQPMKLEEKAAEPLAGGIMNHGFQCGMVWGAALAAGAQAHRLHGPGPRAETAAIVASQRLVDSFQLRNKHINCTEITDMNFQGDNSLRPILKFLIKGGPIGCFRMAAGYAPVAFSEIDTTLSEEQRDVPAPPVSCAALLAQKMGVSELHTTMAAGFAGGIGLSGGACGALAAAIWITAMNIIDQGDGSFDYFNFPEAAELIDRFVESSDYEFECSEIVGRTFEDINDHAGYVQAGGCSKIIEALATQPEV